MKIDFLADTNFLIYLHEGNESIEPFLSYNFGISFISEIELLGYVQISESQIKELSQLINDTYLFNFDEKIKLKTIALKQKYILKLPDAIIAATSIVYGLPLVTADKDFKKIEELDLILINEL